MQSLLADVGENVPKEEEAFQKVEDERVKEKFQIIYQHLSMICAKNNSTKMVLSPNYRI